MDELIEKLNKVYLQQKDIFEAVLDPYVVLTLAGEIVACNTLFHRHYYDNVADSIKNSGFLKCFEMSIGEGKLGYGDLFKGQQLRLDEVVCRQRSSINSQAPRDFRLNISIFPFEDENTGEVLGYFLMMRDVTQEANLQGQYRDTSELSLTDALTGIRNRAYLDQFFNSHFANMVESQKVLAEGRRYFCVIMADIDHFKKINDTYGHQAGDLVIKKVAHILQKTVRKTDVVCRYGGEEFCIILNGANAEQALKVAEKLRSNIEAEEVVYEGKPIKVTSSFGLSEISEFDLAPAESMKRADQALYVSKHSGRNKASCQLFIPENGNLPKSA